MSLAVFFAAALLALQGGAEAAAGGEQIYRQGISPRGTPISASVGGGDALPAALLPCMNCHGADGRGRSEGGVRPADISPAALARPLQNERRRRPAYDAARLRRAITLGIDAGGQPLDAAMPRYGLSLADAEELQAYLARLDQRETAGVDAGEIRIAAIGMDEVVAPSETVYGRRIVLLRERRDDVLLVIDASEDGSASLRAAAQSGIATVVYAAGDAELPASGFAVTASRRQREQRLQSLAAAQGGLLLQRCAPVDAAAQAKPVFLLAEVAAGCAIAALQLAPQQQVYVGMGAPPDAATRSATARAVLELVVDLLKRAGRELTTASLLAALQQVNGQRLGGLPPLSWNARRHDGLESIWLMRLDPQRETLLAQPGWVSATP